MLLQGLDDVPWAELEHAYGSATDVPNLLRKLLDLDPKVRNEAWSHLYGNVFHQGTRFPATPYVIPFLIEMCASPLVPDRFHLLCYWGSLITGYFDVRQRPCWGDGERIYLCGEVQETEEDAPYPEALHAIYRESLKGLRRLLDLLAHEDEGVRAGAAWVLACLPTMASTSVPKLERQLRDEPVGSVRATIAFALGELGATAPLRRMVTGDASASARCMASCQLARIDPKEDLLEPLLKFVSEPIEGYDRIPGTGGKSTGDAAFSISHLPADVRLKAIPAICDRLDQARSLDTMPLVHSLLTAAFSERQEPLNELTDLQRLVLSRMVNTEELWSIANVTWRFPAYGLPMNRDQCAKLIGVKVANDKALAELRTALAFADIDFLEKAREGILKALEIDIAVFERTAAPDESWLLCAKAFAETDPERAMEAFRRACSINPAMAYRVNPSWRLADLLRENGPG